MATSKKI